MDPLVWGHEPWSNWGVAPQGISNFGLEHVGFTKCYGAGSGPDHFELNPYGNDTKRKRFWDNATVDGGHGSLHNRINSGNINDGYGTRQYVSAATLSTFSNNAQAYVTAIQFRYWNKYQYAYMLHEGGDPSWYSEVFEKNWVIGPYHNTQSGQPVYDYNFGGGIH